MLAHIIFDINVHQILYGDFMMLLIYNYAAEPISHANKRIIFISTNLNFSFRFYALFIYKKIQMQINCKMERESIKIK